MGRDSTSIPRALVAALGVLNAPRTAAPTADTVVFSGTAMVAVILTEAAWTAMVTSAAPTPAAEATLLARAEVLL